MLVFKPIPAAGRMQAQLSDTERRWTLQDYCIMFQSIRTTEHDDSLDFWHVSVLVMRIMRSITGDVPDVM